jgi:hypothetical protein
MRDFVITLGDYVDTCELRDDCEYCRMILCSVGERSVLTCIAT